MFLIDEHGERPICTDCRKPFRATANQVAAIRRQWPEIVVICRPCYQRNAGMRSNVAPQPVLQSYKETRSNCPDQPDKLSGPSATIRGWGKIPKDVLRSNLTPAAKLVFAAIAGELYHRETVEMTHAEIGACCGVGERQVRRGLQALVSKRLVEQRRLSVGRVYQYRLLHAEFGCRSNPQPPATETSVETPVGIPAPLSVPVCAKCHLPRRRVCRSGICRGCKAEMDLAVQVRAMRAELGPDASPEQIAARMKEIAEDRGWRRLTARVRRVMETAA